MKSLYFLELDPLAVYNRRLGKKKTAQRYCLIHLFEMSAFCIQHVKILIMGWTVIPLGAPNGITLYFPFFYLIVNINKYRSAGVRSIPFS